MKTDDVEENVSVCANCGKEGSDVTNTCNKCHSVKYCNAACKKKHRHKHKKECEEHLRLAAERADKLHDEALFKQPPLEYEDCPICFLRMPLLRTGRRYQSCCGRVICSGCIYANKNMLSNNNEDHDVCPFCRIPAPVSDEETIEKENQRAEVGDALAILIVGGSYDRGIRGHPQDYAKALELFYRSAELGNALAYYNIGLYYEIGKGVKIDEKKARYYYEVAAIRGNPHARHNLGEFEEEAGNIDRAIKHHMMAIAGGNVKSLKSIQELFKEGYATKEEYTKALRSYQEYLKEIKSSQRDEAAVRSDMYETYKYIE